MRIEDLDHRCRGYLETAANSCPSPGPLLVPHLLSILFHGTSARDRWVDLTGLIPIVGPVRGDGRAEDILDHPTLVGVFNALEEACDFRSRPLSPETLLGTILQFEVGREGFRFLGISPGMIQMMREEYGMGDAWRLSEVRQDLYRKYPDTLHLRWWTMDPPEAGGAVGMDDIIRDIAHRLIRSKYRAVVLTGDHGVGKTAYIKELARRLARRDPSLPEPIRDYDLVKIEPGYLSEEMLWGLTSSGKVIPFMEGIPHAFFMLAREGVPCLSCTTTTDFAKALEIQPDLGRRIAEVLIPAPTRDQTLAILSGRRLRLAGDHTVNLTRHVLEKVVDLTERELPDRHQPEKSIRLLEDTCHFCLFGTPPRRDITPGDVEAVFWKDYRAPTDAGCKWQADEILARLKELIVGQDDVLESIATGFAGGFGHFGKRRGPRGVFMFAGPTGVGKTETALALAGLLGGESRALLRINCNMLGGQGRDGGPIEHRLFGPPPGYQGYEMGGLLTPISKMGDCIVLFDEIEKAGPLLSKYLLQIIDDGEVKSDSETMLDFRRAFIIFTTNAGVATNRKVIGFGSTRNATEITLEAVKSALFRTGESPFLGRIRDWFLFHDLSEESVRIIVERQMKQLRQEVMNEGFFMNWHASVLDRLAGLWEEEFGARAILNLFQSTVLHHLNIAYMENLLEKGMEIEIRTGNALPGRRPGQATRSRQDGKLIITLE